MKKQHSKFVIWWILKKCWYILPPPPSPHGLPNQNKNITFFNIKMFHLLNKKLSMKIKYFFQSFSLTQRMKCCYLLFTTFHKAQYYWFFSFKWKCLLFTFHIDYILVFERNCLNRTYALSLTIPIEENQINDSEWKSNEKTLTSYFYLDEIDFTHRILWRPFLFCPRRHYSKG